MSIRTVILCLISALYFWSSQSLALSCGLPKPSIEERMANVAVIAIVKTEADVKSRVMKTITTLKGEAKDRYYYEAPLINPIPNTCCVEIEPNTEYLIFAGGGDRIGYSVCESNGVQHPIVQSNGSPPYAFIYTYIYLETSNQEKIIDFLSTYWPEVRAKWITGIERLLYRGFNERLREIELRQLKKQRLGAQGESFEPREASEAEIRLDESFRNILKKWNPIIVEDNLDSPYLSKQEREALESGLFLKKFSEKYPTEDPAELLMLRHKNGEVSDFEYKFFRQRCETSLESDYCAIFK